MPQPRRPKDPAKSAKSPPHLATLVYSKRFLTHDAISKPTRALGCSAFETFAGAGPNRGRSRVARSLVWPPRLSCTLFVFLFDFILIIIFSFLTRPMPPVSSVHGWSIGLTNITQMANGQVRLGLVRSRGRRNYSIQNRSTLTSTFSTTSNHRS
ncbi:hypothetical protein VTK26DRAFT_2712 [Humicola hyalothermophila]